MTILAAGNGFGRASSLHLNADLESGEGLSNIAAEVCPITLQRIDSLEPHQIYRTISGNHRYEREALCRWFQQDTRMPHCNEDRPEDRRQVLTEVVRRELVQQINNTALDTPHAAVGVDRNQWLKSLARCTAFMVFVSWPAFLASSIHMGRFRDNHEAKIAAVIFGTLLGISGVAICSIQKTQNGDAKQAVSHALNIVAYAHLALGVPVFPLGVVGLFSKDDIVLSIFYAGLITIGTAAVGGRLKIFDV